MQRLRELDKEELIERVISLQLEKEALQGCLSRKGREWDDALVFPGSDSWNFLQAFLEHFSSLVFTLSADGRVTYVNRSCLHLLGYRREEMVGRGFLEFVHDDHKGLILGKAMLRMRGGSVPIPVDVKILKKDGGVCWVEMFGVRVEGIPGVRPFLLGSAIDITARIEAASALRESENRFRVLAEHLQAAVYMSDPDGRLIYANPYTSEITGYSNRELLTMRVLDLVHPDSREAARKLATDYYELKIITKQGEVKWVEARSHKLQLQDQSVTLGVALDISRRVADEQALKEGEKKFRLLFERSSDPMFLLDRYSFFDCNEAALKRLQAKDKNDVRVHHSRLSPERQPDGSPSREKARKMIDLAYEKGFNRFEWLHRDLAGRNFWTDVSLTVIPFEHRDMIFTVWRDISAFKELEELLREEREQLLVTLRSIGDAVITTDLEGRVELMNRVAEQLTGWSQAEARGRGIDEILDLYDLETGDRVRNPLNQAMEKGAVLEFEDDLILHSRDGRRLKVTDSASPIRDEKSQIIGGVLVFRDVTEKERMQEEVFKLRKLESVGRLAGGIAHDFNNLLAGIMGNIEIALMRFESRDSRLRENLEKALKASRRGADLTRKLLTFAKGGEPIRESTDIAEIIRDSAEFSLLGSQVALRLELPEGLWAADVDAGQISQVIQNLVINAVHAMPEGGLLTISGENVEVGLSQAVTLSLKPGFYVKIAIRDQGCGIPEELQARIFDPFFTTKDEGSGLGLSVVHSIVNKHDGCVKVLSQPGSFTEFTLYLPALGRLPERLPLKPRVIKPAGTARRILIMDDEEIVREILQEMLTSHGYEVTAVRDGWEAVGEYRKKAFDLVITDLTIPGGLGGRETVRLLKEYDPDAKVVVSSGYANNPVMAGYEKYGFCGCLDKPYNMEELLRLIARILG